MRETDRTVCCRTLRLLAWGVILRRHRPGRLLNDRDPALPELRLYLHGNLPCASSGPGKHHAGGLRALSIHPLVNASGLTFGPVLALELGDELTLLLRLLVAAGLAAILGWERETAHKAAGLRTHMLVGIASALFTVLAELAVNDYPGVEGGLRSDPIRVIQAVAIGIGFLGSGVIFVARDGEHVIGLTTAASVWATAAIGIAAGLGHFIIALGSTALLVLVLRGLARFDRGT